MMCTGEVRATASAATTAKRMIIAEAEGEEEIEGKEEDIDQREREGSEGLTQLGTDRLTDTRTSSRC